ncbi:unnamed protein product [Cylindrotheca closterium]|uniref:Uncharacterized protein n=1 Tax=Cylindrotheca closterium TaxID=2856 RepID=A0AAD2JK46_9STRA|nr:unnamed protein product [Cylindrotheca closterium]
MNCFKIPPKLRLSAVTATPGTNDKNENGFVISGKLQPDTGSFRDLKSSDNGTQLAYEGILLQKEYVVRDDQRSYEGGQQISFSVPLGKESQSWKPRHTGKVYHRQGHHLREGQFEVKYTVKASITSIPARYNNEICDSCHWSNAVELQFVPSDSGSNNNKNKTRQHDVLRVDLGAPVMIPQTSFFCLAAKPPNPFCTLIPTEFKIQLFPNQQLAIQLCQNPPSKDEEEAIVVDLKKVHVKFTQRNVLNGDIFDRHWEQMLLPCKKSSTSSTNKESPNTTILQGTVSVPGNWTPSYDGSIVQIVNEMIIYITEDGQKGRDVVATSPKIAVELQNNAVLVL